MFIVPELKTVFILPPRTGSPSLIAGLKKVYPASFLLYRHMEADGVPAGYEMWRRVGFVRHPLSRLWSLYKYCAVIGAEFGVAPQYEAHVRYLRESVKGVGFERWLVENETLFIPFSEEPLFRKRHYLPENLISQQLYLRPDLDTEVLPFSTLADRMAGWGIKEKVHFGKTPYGEPPALGAEAWRHLERVCRWELSLDLEVL